MPRRAVAGRDALVSDLQLHLAPGLLHLDPDPPCRGVLTALVSASRNATIVLIQLAQLGYRQLALYVDGTEGWIETGLPVD